MFDSFLSAWLNPYAALAGALLVSVPIIIHLINRLRFRRVRWAAMEFLLRSQKRNQRKVILQQMLLLLMRILLVLLAGVLLGRFTGCGGSVQQAEGLHVVLLDDTLSTSELRRQDGQQSTAFAEGKRQIVESLAPAALLAPTAQTLAVVFASDPENATLVDRLTAQSLAELRGTLDGRQSSYLHAPLSPALEKAREMLDKAKPATRRRLYLVGDFRQRDWKGSDADALKLAFERFQAAGTSVSLVDVASPARTEKVTAPVGQDNLAVVDLRAEAQVVARNVPVEFTATLANFGTADRTDLRLDVAVNGFARPQESPRVARLGANERATVTFTLSFDRTGTDAKPLDRFSVVTATVTGAGAENGLAADNARRAVVEVRDRVPILVIEDSPPGTRKEAEDSYFLRKLFVESQKGYEFVVRPPSALDKLDLSPFPCVLVLDVPRLGDAAKANLERYTRDGGGVGFFLGPDARPDLYNALYADGNGLFPAPLADKPADAPTPDERLRRALAEGSKVWPRDPRHPLLRALYGTNSDRNLYDVYLSLVRVDQYWPVVRSRWKPRPDTHEVMTLANPRQLADYARPAAELADALGDALNADDAAPHRPALRKYQEQIRQLTRDKPADGEQPKSLSELAKAVDGLLNDPGDPKDAARPPLAEFWQKPERAALRKKVSDFLDDVRYGDPFLVTKVVGRGRVAAYLSSPNDSWNDFPSPPQGAYYGPLMLSVQRYLAGGQADANWLTGSTVTAQVDANRFQSKAHRWLAAGDGPGAQPQAGAADKAFEDLGEQDAGDPVDGRHVFRFGETQRPGVYALQFDPKSADGEATGSAETKPRPDYQAFAVNVDAEAEGDLSRVSTDDLKKSAPGAEVVTPDYDWRAALGQRSRDLSEGPWLYVLLLVLLIVEQALAVHLSYHARGDATPAARTFGARAGA